MALVQVDVLDVPAAPPRQAMVQVVLAAPLPAGLVALPIAAVIVMYLA